MNFNYYSDVNKLQLKPFQSNKIFFYPFFFLFPPPPQLEQPEVALWRQEDRWGEVSTFPYRGSPTCEEAEGGQETACFLCNEKFHSLNLPFTRVLT